MNQSLFWPQAYSQDKLDQSRGQLGRGFDCFLNFKWLSVIHKSNDSYDKNSLKSF